MAVDTSHRRQLAAVLLVALTAISCGRGAKRSAASGTASRLATLLATAPPGVTPYLPATGAIPSPTFRLKVNGSPVFAESFGGISYARFALSVAAHVEVVDQDLAGYDLSPRSLGVKAKAKGHVSTFDLTTPQKLLFWNGTGVGDMLMILADPPESESFAPGKPGVVDVATLGVSADGDAVQTAPIQAALDHVASVGGVLYFGPGTYRTGTLRIGSRTTVYLASGATLRGTGSPDDYPRDPEITDGVSGGQAGVPEVAQLEFDSATGSRLLGRGTVDMNGTGLRAEGSRGGRLLILKNSQHIEVRDVLLRDPASWNTQILHSTDVTFSNVKVVNHAGPPWNTDGINVDGSQRVVVDGAFVYSGDDSFAVKNTGCYQGRTLDPTDIIIKNSTAYSLTAGLKLGTESLGSAIERVTYENDDVIEADCGIRIVIRDGAACRNDTWRHIRVEHVSRERQNGTSSPFQFLITRRHPKSLVGSFENITLDDVQVGDPGLNPSAFSGFDQEHRVTGLTFTDVTITGRRLADLRDFSAALNDFATAPTFSHTK